MINPDIIKKYGNESEQIFLNICGLLTVEERDSIYAEYTGTIVNGKSMPAFFTSDRSDLVKSICNKVMMYIITLDEDAILVCNNRTKDGGIKVWLNS